ncbi:MAG: TIGR00341 family protein, partial [Planctomycetota bacterium]|nr:TIGR00341 family protein [Planctomycetota bacterium]
MAERLIEIYAPSSRTSRVQNTLLAHHELWWCSQTFDRGTLFLVTSPAEEVESILEPVQAALGTEPGARIIVLPVEATLPKREDQRRVVEAPNGEEQEEDANRDTRKSRRSSRISRDELYEDLQVFSKITPVFIAMTFLSTIVAAVGLARDSAAIVIGAMVIAPLLGPNMALALAATLGNTNLAIRSIRANAVGLTLALVAAFGLGFFWEFNEESREILSRTEIEFSDLVLALAAGAAGALAFTTGAPASVVGVMVAVALLPPGVVFAMLLGAGRMNDAMGALLLLSTNVICVNLAAVATFLIQGVRPSDWWSHRRTLISSGLALI